jgi:hypothetical protein
MDIVLFIAQALEVVLVVMIFCLMALRPRKFTVPLAVILTGVLVVISPLVPVAGNAIGLLVVILIIVDLFVAVVIYDVVWSPRFRKQTGND